MDYMFDEWESLLSFLINLSILQGINFLCIDSVVNFFYTNSFECMTHAHDLNSFDVA